MSDFIDLRSHNSNKFDKFVNIFLPQYKKLNTFSEEMAIKIKVFIPCVLFSLLTMTYIHIRAMSLFGFYSTPVLASAMGLAALSFYIINLKTIGNHQIGATIILFTTTIGTCLTVYHEHLFEAGNIYWIMAYIFFGVYLVGPWIVFYITPISLTFITGYILLVIIDHPFPFEHHFPKDIVIYEGIKAAFMITLITILSYFYEKGRLKNIKEIDRINNDLFSEINKIQKIQREKEEIMAKLIQTEKLASLGEMAGGIAHEINNPLAIIDGTIRRIYRILQHDTVDKEKISSYLNDIHTVTKRVVKIINGLRSFARDGNDDPLENVTLQSMIENIKHLSAEKFKSKGIKMDTTIMGSDISIKCRRVQIEQVILNLLNNAYDAIVDLKDKWITIDIKGQDNMAQIIITDSGNGIPEDIQQKIMFPFFTTKKVGKGTGLGLSISRGIIENHYGTLTLNTQAPNTQFIISLPTTIKS